MFVAILPLSQQVVRSRAPEQERRELAREADGGRQCLELSRGQFNVRYSEQLNVPAPSAEELLLSSTSPVPSGARCPRSSFALARLAALRARTALMRASLGIVSILEDRCSRDGGDAMLVCLGGTPTVAAGLACEHVANSD